MGKKKRAKAASQYKNGKYIVLHLVELPGFDPSRPVGEVQAHEYKQVKKRVFLPPSPLKDRIIKVMPSLFRNMKPVGEHPVVKPQPGHDHWYDTLRALTEIVEERGPEWSAFVVFETEGNQQGNTQLVACGYKPQDGWIDCGKVLKDRLSRDGWPVAH